MVFHSIFFSICFFVLQCGLIIEIRNDDDGDDDFNANFPIANDRVDTDNLVVVFIVVVVLFFNHQSGVCSKRKDDDDEEVEEDDVDVPK